MMHLRLFMCHTLSLMMYGTLGACQSSIRFDDSNMLQQKTVAIQQLDKMVIIGGIIACVAQNNSINGDQLEISAHPTTLKMVKAECKKGEACIEYIQKSSARDVNVTFMLTELPTHIELYNAQLTMKGQLPWQISLVCKNAEIVINNAGTAELSTLNIKSINSTIKMHNKENIVIKENDIQLDKSLIEFEPTQSTIHRLVSMRAKEKSVCTLGRVTKFLRGEAHNSTVSYYGNPEILLTFGTEATSFKRLRDGS